MKHSTKRWDAMDIHVPTEHRAGMSGLSQVCAKY